VQYSTDSLLCRKAHSAQSPLKAVPKKSLEDLDKILLNANNITPTTRGTKTTSMQYQEEKVMRRLGSIQKNADPCPSSHKGADDKDNGVRWRSITHVVGVFSKKRITHRGIGDCRNNGGKGAVSVEPKKLSGNVQTVERIKKRPISEMEPPRGRRNGEKL